MSFRVDAVEIMNRFTEYSPSRGETPLPLPIPGFWFKRICALADRVAKAENQNDDLNAQVAALTAALREANEDGLDIATLEYAAKWIENSLAGETSDRVIEFGKSMAMSIRAAKPLVKICAECGGSGEVAGDYFSDDGMSTCARCNGVGHERI